MRRFIAGPIFAAGFLLTTTALATDLPGDAVAGEKMARGLCAQCHWVAEDQKHFPVEDAPAFQDLAENPAITELALRAFFQTPHRSMPNLMLSPQETDDIISYILSLRQN